ncbi:MAG: hypothetical protein L7F78_09920, partial [Syntrophales bacterium LBB04]|nr:hypothetical protein [Syntrophales bacterium LBB04]
GSHFWLALSAFFFGLAALVRPVAQFIPLLMAFFLLLSLRKERKKALLMTCFFALFFLLTISPWMIRNLVQFNTPALSVVGEYDLTILYVQPMEMERRGQAFSKIRKSLLDEADQLMIRDGLDPQKMNDFQKGRYWKKLAFHYISRYPYSFLKHYLFGIAHTLGNLATGPYVEMLQLSKNTSKFSIKGHSSLVKLGKAWFQQKTWPEMGIGLIIGFYLLVTYTLSAIGVLTFWRKYRHQLLLWFSFILVFYFLFITGTAGLARYKLPAVPFYLPFVGLGLKHVLNRWFSTETGNLKN